MDTHTEISRIVGQRVRDLRTRKAITRETLAEKIEVSSRFLADVEAGKVGVSLITLRKLAVYFGVSADYLLGLEQDTDPYEETCRYVRRVDENALPQLNTIVCAFAEATQSGALKKQ